MESKTESPQEPRSRSKTLTVDGPRAAPDEREMLLRAAAGWDETPRAMRGLLEVDVLIADPITPIHDRVAALVEACDPFSADLLCLAAGLGRGAGAGTRRGPEDLPAIIARFGLAGFRRMVELVASRNLFRATSAPVSRRLSEIWWHSLARAEAMRLVAERVEVPRRWLTGNLYTAGLFADVGAMFLLWLVEQARLPAADDGGLLASTLELIGEHHEWVGEDLLQRWGMAVDITRTAGNHHGRRSGVRTPFWPIVAIAGQIADEVVEPLFLVAQRQVGDVREPAEAAAHFLPLGVEERRHLLFAVRKQVEGLRNVLEPALAPTPAPSAGATAPGSPAARRRAG
jgi:HD-like signal output (HDOD) protein